MAFVACHTKLLKIYSIQLVKEAGITKTSRDCYIKQKQHDTVYVDLIKYSLYRLNRVHHQISYSHIATKSRVSTFVTYLKFVCVTFIEFAAEILISGHCEIPVIVLYMGHLVQADLSEN